MGLTLRPYQVQGIDFLADRGRAALFDEPGLGKSMQAALAMRDLVPNGRILVVATGDAIGVWQDEIRLWCDEEPAVFAGLKPDPANLGPEGAFTITNYHRLSAAFDEAKWDGVIFDEAQALRNRKTATLFKAVRAAYDHARTGLYRVPTFLLSGTPIVKATGDLWPLMHILDKREWSSYWKFVNKYAVVWHDRFGWHVEGVTGTKQMWADLSPWALRRTVAEVQPNLPPKVRQRVPLEMTSKQARIYGEIERDMLAEIEAGDPTSGLILTPTVLAQETRLRQLLVSPRLLDVDDDGAAILALLERAKSNPRPFVIFTPFPTAFPYIEQVLVKAGRPIYTVRGGTGLEFRKGVDLFVAAAKVGEAPILMASVEMAKSWSVSRYTHECFMLGAAWNGTTMGQAESRLHRDGQEDTVFAKYLVHPGTIDYHQLDVISGKWRLADAILDRSRH
jgi:SNF2 family DNA or RNA helicase